MKWVDLVSRLHLHAEEWHEGFDDVHLLLIEAADEIVKLREVVMLLVAYDEHDEDIYKGAVMWDVLIESAHAALKEKE